MCILHMKANRPASVIIPLSIATSKLKLPLSEGAINTLAVFKQNLYHENVLHCSLKLYSSLHSTMALAPKFAGQRLASSSLNAKAVHTLELCRFLTPHSSHPPNTSPFSLNLPASFCLIIQHPPP